MKTWQYVVFVGLMAVLLLAVLNFIPGTSRLVRGVLQILKMIWIVISGFVLGVLIITFGILSGWLTKAFGISYLDSKLERQQGITGAMHWGIAILLGLVFGVIQAALMPVVMNWNTWIRTAVMGIGWSGVFETLPLYWFVWCFISFVVTYLVSSYYEG